MSSRIRSIASAGLLSVAVFAASTAVAQPGAGEEASEDPSLVREPPAIVHLPELSLPKGLEVPPEALEVTVRVDVSGRAVLEESAAQGPLRERIEALLSEARFVPASLGGEAREARVRLRFRVAQPASEQAPAAAAAVPEPESTDQAATPRPEFGARAEVDPPRPTARKLELSAMREVPGAFGDPFRVLDTLPGVVPVFSGLPYVYVRGAPPAGTVYVYDDIAVPALFHLALGPAVIHPAMIGDLQFYSAVPPARYGRRTGGVFAAQGPDFESDAPPGGEVELRLLDVQAMVNAPLGDGRLVLAGRYGYPGLLLSVFSPEAMLAYWDYQARLRQRLSGPDWLEVTWFGSFDKAGEKGEFENLLSLEFHRAEVRLIRERPDYELGLALQAGLEHSALGDLVGVEALRLGPRLWSRFQIGDVRARLGADMLATVGRIELPDDDEGGDSPPPADFPGPRSMPDQVPSSQQPPRLAEPEGDPADSDQRIFDDPLYGAVAGRNQMGVYAELEIPLGAGFGVEPGLRLDAWFSGSRAQQALEPRLIVTYRPVQPLLLHAGAGLGHQLASLPIALPGFSDVALEAGLQRSIQSELGASWTLSDSLLLEAELFYNRMSDLILAELFLECESDDSPLCPEDGLARGDVDAYGLELFVKRDPKETLSGWLSYTLAWADGQTSTPPPATFVLPGVAHELRYTQDGSFTPEFDVRHVANLVLQWRVGGGFSAGARVHYRSGKVQSQGVFTGVGYLRLERRLPGFFRADAQIAYRWRTSWGHMRLALEWMNLTLSREPVSLECKAESTAAGRSLGCEVDYAPAIFFPNLGLRAEF